MIPLSNEILIPKIADDIRQGYTVTLPLRGFSMRPYLEDGRDKALLVPVTSELRIGDVVLAEISNKRWALHRIVRVVGEDITLYGDGNFSPEYIKRSDVIAIAAGFYRKNSEKLSKCDAPLYQLYWRVWVRLRPVRRYLLLIWKFWHYPGLTIKEIKSKLNK